MAFLSSHFLLLLLLVLAFQTTSSSPSSPISTNFSDSDVNANTPTPTPTPTPIDYNLLAIQWPKSFCTSTEVSPGVPCDGSVGKFTIHGLWPHGGTNSTIPYNRVILQPEEQNLIDKWPNLLESTRHTHQEFWMHEWHEHGVMSGMKLDKYFKQTMQLYDNLHITTSIGNLKPGLPYSLTDLQTEISRIFGHQVIIKCGTDRSNTQIQLLQEIRFNFTTTLLKQPTTYKSYGCNVHRNIFFPA